MQNRAFADKISFALDSEIAEIAGMLGGVALREVFTGATHNLDATDLFIAIVPDPARRAAQGPAGHGRQRHVVSPWSGRRVLHQHRCAARSDSMPRVGLRKQRLTWSLVEGGQGPNLLLEAACSGEFGRERGLFVI
jgi:hypothetical protein